MTVDLYNKIFHFFLVAIIISICYSGILENSWHFDDSHNIVKNKNIHIENLSWEQIKRSLYSPTDGRIHRPLARFSFALNYFFSGLDTTSYYVVNILVHIVSSIFVYLVFFITLQIYRERRGSSISDYNIRDVALLGAIFWAIHPIQTQAVTYIVQRMASMATMFFLISMYCYLRFRQNSQEDRRGLLLFLAFFFWIVGVSAKENVVILPLVLLGYEIAFFRVSLLENKKYFIMIIALFFGVSISAFLLMRGEIFNYIEHLYSVRYYSMWQRLITEPIILAQYLFLLICPLADFLSLESDIIASSSLLSPLHTFFANFFIFSLTLFSILSLKKYPILAFSLYFYFICHLIESSFIGLELYFEHRNYLSSIFIYFGIAYFLYTVLFFYKKRNKKIMYLLFVSLVVSIIVSEGNATYLRNEVWKDEISLNLDNIEKAPYSIRGFNNLAAEYISLGQTDNALHYLKQAEKIYKQNPEIYQKNHVSDFYYNAGLVQLYGKEDVEKSIQLFLESVELDPVGFEQHYQLAVAFFKIGDLANAETAIFNAVQLKNDEFQLYNLFARILYAQKKYELASEVISKGIELVQPNKRREMYFNSSAIFIALGNKKRARSFLLMIDTHNNDLLFFLYMLAISSESDRDIIGKRIVNILQEKKINYCKWIDEIDRNDRVKIIYPDIISFRNDLDKAYVDKMNSTVNAIDLEVNVVNTGCNDL